MGVVIALKKLVHAWMPRRLVNFVWNLSSDVKDLIEGRRKSAKPQPWRVLHNVGGGDFHATGRHFFSLFSQAVNFRPSDHVLDLGCGAGRLSFPIAEALDESGRYTGFDLSDSALGFARKHVKSRGCVDFFRSDVKSAEYGASGMNAHQYRFPAEDGSIDAALAISLFSHLLPLDATHYLAETGRVLRPGGRLFLTGFLIENDQLPDLTRPDRKLPMEAFSAGVWAADIRHPERAIGFEKALFDEWIEAAGLVWAAPPVRGFWSRTEAVGNFQDAITLERRATH
ncbi:methyltransferase domain-containing protein [Maricaulis sp.]|uniref:class I SAM-dependent methyltransferase n=1 Tax=Maricaulis sp. TaxID=1486257 RepID=UPI0025BC1886|nr:methyltransferase domain-containing protein [Maricaulis sp.]